MPEILIPRSSSGKSPVEVAIEVSLAAGEILLDRFHNIKEVHYKGRGTIVTDVDTTVEKEIFSMLRREFPDIATLGEETGGGDVDNGLIWVVDPLDGTRNYASGIPFFSTVVGLVSDGEILVGVNYDPVRNDLFSSMRGEGAYLNGERIFVSNKLELEECIFGMDLSYNNEGAVNGLDVIRSIWPGMQTTRIMGSSALGISYAAAGRTDIYFHHQLEPWDQVAGLLLVEEAGGVITDRKGERAGLRSDGLVASNQTLHAMFMHLTEGMAWRRPAATVGRAE